MQAFEQTVNKITLKQSYKDELLKALNEINFGYIIKVPTPLLALFYIYSPCELLFTLCLDLRQSKEPDLS